MSGLGRRRRVVLLLMISLASLLQTVTPAVAHPLDHWHGQWVTYTIFEQYAVTAAMLEAGMTFDMSYADNDMENVVEDQSHQRCYVSSFPGWINNDCTWYTYGPGIPQADGFGYFYHATQVEVRLYATTYSYDNSWSFACTMQEGSLPPLWYEQCDSTRTEN